MLVKLIPVIIGVYLIIHISSLVTSWELFGINLAPILGLAALLSVVGVMFFYLRQVT